MKRVMLRISRVPAATAALALIGGFGVAAAADYPPRRGFQYQTPPSVDERTPPVPEAGVPSSQAPNNTCFYLNYDPNANLGQGSGNSLGRAQRVCR